jgi:septal ring factor EnvC (AmiA/AmiB activator)
MIDDKTTTHHTPADFAAVANLLALVVDMRSCKARLRSLHDALAATSAAQAKLDAERAAFAEHEAATRAALAKREAELDELQVELANIKTAREFSLRDREQRIADLERIWAFAGETDEDVRRGIRAPQFSALAKAKAAFGISADQAVTPPTPPLRPAFLDDTNGIPFPDHVTVTRSS